MTKISIVGTVGVPASYGGFETLADNLVQYACNERLDVKLSVYCSGRCSEKEYYRSARLYFIPIGANGVSSILYDSLSLICSVLRRDQVILLLGVSGAILIPFIRLVSEVKIITNIDGIEWRRDKWNRFAKLFLRLSEFVAVRFSHEVIADNVGIAEHVSNAYSSSCHVISYGGDHALVVNRRQFETSLPDNFALALCRIEPENNIAMILATFAVLETSNLVFVGNWQSSHYGRSLKQHYGGMANIDLIDPIYDSGVLRTIRSKASFYVHGHSAGGTNPSLVEMMHFGIPVFAFDCAFNRYTTHDKAIFFSDSHQLEVLINTLDCVDGARVGAEMRALAKEYYTWERIGGEYFNVLLG